MEPTIVNGFQSMQIRWSKLSKSETSKSDLNSTSIARSRVVRRQQQEAHIIFHRVAHQIRAVKWAMAARRQQHETHHTQISMDSMVGQRSSPIRLQIQKPSRTAGHE
ncbi:hypothetical protein ACLOJK_034798 [Asimina triloba]